MRTNSLVTNILAGIIFASFSANASNSPIKSIDASGNVTYGDKPVTGATEISKIPIHAGPSADEIKSAQKQAQKNIAQADKIDLTPPKKTHQPNTTHTIPTTGQPVTDVNRKLLRPAHKLSPAKPINRPAQGGGGRR